MNQRKENIELGMELSQVEKMDKVLNPKVSVIVPAFNVEKYISKCLLSLLNQTLKDIEIVVINDGSTDKTLEIVEKFEELDKRIRIINQENQKQGAARNRGMEIATGEYIGFVDSDDWVDLDYFEKLYLAAKKYNSDIVKFKESIDENGFISGNKMGECDGMEITVCGNDERILLIARYDNLGKGASGAAVQCLNIKMGIDPKFQLNV